MLCHPYCIVNCGQEMVRGKRVQNRHKETYQHYKETYSHYKETH